MKEVLIKLGFGAIIFLGFMSVTIGAGLMIDYVLDFVGLIEWKTKHLNTLISNSYIAVATAFTIGYFLNKVKFNKTKKKSVNKLLKEWRKERNINNSDTKLYVANIVEELLEIYYEDKEVIKSYQSSIMKTYFYPVEISPLNTIDSICDIQVFSINEVENKGFSNKKAMIETIKEIDSRKQDPQQKEEWFFKGANGKWKKDINQAQSTLYKADYSKCKL